MTPAHWTDGNTRCFGMLLDGTAPVSSIPRPGTDATVLLVFNGWHEGVTFTLPTAPKGQRWHRLFDTALEVQVADTFTPRHDYVVTGRSVLAVATAGAGPSADALNRLLAEFG
jgi:glycogen operon protein